MAGPSAIMPSDALVFFGASGDLAFERIFPSQLGWVRDAGPMPGGVGGKATQHLQSSSQRVLLEGKILKPAMVLPGVSLRSRLRRHCHGR